MGYDTRYRVQAMGSVDTEQAALEINEKFVGYNLFDKDGHAFDDAKWYMRDFDMIRLSQRHPNATFALRGIGERRDDDWVKIFHEGKMYKCDLSVDMFALAAAVGTQEAAPHEV